MKKQFFLGALIVLFSINTVWAQGNRQKMSPQEKAVKIMGQLAPLQLNDEQVKKTQVVFLSFFEEQQKANDEARANGNFDREVFMAKRKELIAKRDAELSKIFTEEQMKKWNESVEPGFKFRKKEAATN